MGIYDERILPRFIDIALRGPATSALRAEALTSAKGRVLEVGFGTGLSARHYPPSGVEQLVVIDSNPGMTRLAAARLASAGRSAEHAVLSGERLPFSDRSFDTVVVQFTLCSIPDVSGALLEMRRVLKPDGRLLYLEHGLADDENIRRWQQRLTPLWSPFTGGCHLNRDTTALLEAAGFGIIAERRARLQRMPAVVGSCKVGVASPVVAA